MTGFARNILAAHEQAGALSGHGRAGGSASHLGRPRPHPAAPDPARFRRDNPLVDFDLTVDQSGLLHQRLEDDKLDVFVGKRPKRRARAASWSGGTAWSGSAPRRPGSHLSRPLPLVVYPAPSTLADRDPPALNRARLPFRSACVCRGVNGLIAAVAAGIGISALAASLVPAQLTALGTGHRLPELGTIDLVLLTNPRRDQRPAVRALISAVLASGSRSLTAYRDENPAVWPKTDMTERGGPDA